MIDRIVTHFKTIGLFRTFKLMVVRLLTSAMAFPIVLTIIFVSPWIKIRLIRLFSYRIGHYSLNTELLLCGLDKNLFNESKKIKNFFYTFPHEPICNQQLHQMWKRIITILPGPLLWREVDRQLMIVYGKKYRDDPMKVTFETASGNQDKWNFLDSKSNCHLTFTEKEKYKGAHLLKALGISEGSPFICLLGRDGNYLKQYLPDTDWSYHDYRDFSIQTYKKMALFLAEAGYYVIRMGKDVKDPFIVNHPQVIDYANHPSRSDFLDIYLAAHCFFFISPRSGIDGVAQIFRRPLLLTNFPLCDFWSLFDLDLLIPKKVLNKKTNQWLTFKEMCWVMERRSMMKILEDKEWHFVENTEDELVEVADEMVKRLTHSWHESEEHAQLQEQFWQLIPIEKSLWFYDRMKMRIGHVFLKRYESLLTH